MTCANADRLMRLGQAGKALEGIDATALACRSAGTAARGRLCTPLVATSTGPIGSACPADHVTRPTAEPPPGIDLTGGPSYSADASLVRTAPSRAPRKSMQKENSDHDHRHGPEQRELLWDHHQEGQTRFAMFNGRAKLESGHRPLFAPDRRTQNTKVDEDDKPLVSSCRRRATRSPNFEADPTVNVRPMRIRARISTSSVSGTSRTRQRQREGAPAVEQESEAWFSGRPYRSRPRAGPGAHHACELLGRQGKQDRPASEYGEVGDDRQGRRPTSADTAKCG
jgi:hypothetical protein